MRPLCTQDEAALLVANAAKFKSWFNVDVKENTEVSRLGMHVCMCTCVHGGITPICACAA
jgi:hypothetical protein